MYGYLFSDLHGSKGLKLSSSTAPVRPSSNLMNINIDDLPEAVLLEILSRLPSYRYVSQCKCVSKRWCTLMSDPSFICSFISLQRDSDQTVRTLINKDGREFLTRMSSSLDSLAPLFQRLMRFHRLEKEPVVLGAYNDLVLCCASYTYQRDYYICNPCTYQWAPLPPPPRVHKWTPVGFICDVPYYQCKEGDNDQKGKFIQVNTEYRGRVVRLITICQGKFNVQIFSTETGEWTESIVSFPSLGFGFVTDIRPNMSFPYNGMLYWMGYSSEFIIGLDPFMITDRNNTSLPSNSTPGDEYKFRFIKIDWPGHGDDIIDDLYCLGEHRGSLQFYTYNITKAIITVYQLNKEATLEGAGKICLQDGWVEYELDWEILPDEDEHILALAFDPNSDGSLYLQRATYQVTSARHADIFMYNKRKGWSIIAENIPSPKNNGYNEDYHQVALPCWPTPVPRQHASTVSSHPSQFQAPSHSS